MNIDLAQLPHAALTYANAGEDLALRKMFKRRLVDGVGGTYVDIGCAAPVSTSNTYLFYCMGWRGVCVDANPDAAPYWADVRPEDQFVSAAIGEREGSASLFRHRDNLGMHKLANFCPSPDFLPTPDTVPLLRLDRLLQTHLPGRSIQFMSLDVEGAEMGVLKSNDWQKWRPVVILMACLTFEMLAPRESESVAFLLDHDYRQDAKISGNVVFVAK